MRRIFHIALQLVFATGLLAVAACGKKEGGLGENPYAGGKPPLGVTFERLNRPLPSARPNDVILVSVRGLKEYANVLEAYVNEEPSQVVSVSDSTMEVRLPDHVASGILKLKINEQIFFGPKVTVEGKVRIDTDYGIVNGYDMWVSQILPVSPNMWVVGSFTNFENEASNTVFRNGISVLNSTGKSVTEVTSYNPGRGAEGGLSSITRLPDGKFIVAGNMASYNRLPVNGLTRLLPNGALDTARVELINTTPERPQNAFDTLPAFNANLYGSVVKVFATPDTGVIAVGGFLAHSYVDYTFSSRETKTHFMTNVNNIVRLKANGRVDSTFSFQNIRANGFVSDAVQLSDGRIVVVGSFTTFNGVTANRIVAFNLDGSINTNFAANIGVGANADIFSISYNATRNKIALAGRFSTFAGKPRFGVVILNADGTIDETFTLGDVEGRIPNYAYVMNSGQILVSGDFVRYNGINRSKLLILEPTGAALQDYNNMGSFFGRVNTVIETTSSLGHPALLIGGSIGMADGRPVGNIFKLEVRN
ncbi:MAG TPA: DUF5008 domain-containing protein [Sphingobacterium sp.]|nr:DUF5008 domain-containing protein [Sphingobacterium sp.]